MIAAAVGSVAIFGAARHAAAQQWLVDANQRIEQYRKANLTIDVVDALGEAVAGADLHFQMKRHSFGFGTAVPAGWINNTSANGVMFREKLLENFNQVVFENDLKWPPWIGLWGGGFNWPNTEQAMDWLDANNLPIRGHYLSWATWSGSDAWGTSHANPPQNVVDTLPQRLLAHITDKATTVGNRVFEWDVINHPVGWLNDTYENRIPSGVEFYADIIDHARSVAPEGMPMWINEDDVIAGNARANDYERIIRYLVDNGSPPDGIGFQGHFIQEWGRVTSSSPQQVYNRIERFAAFDLPLRATEFDIDVGSDEAWQGQLMHDYLTVMFSHPAMEAITLWGFWGGSHWRGQDGALYRTDWTEKPSLAAYRDLVFSQWWTDESGTSDAAGQEELRAFKGLYDIAVSFNGQQYVFSDIQLDDDMNVLLTLPDVNLLPGDFDGNGAVENADLTLLLNNWGEPVPPAPAGWVGSPLTAPAVDNDELTALLNNWGSVAGTGASAAGIVPEPASTLLLLVALVTFGGTIRARRGPLRQREIVQRGMSSIASILR